MTIFLCAVIAVLAVTMLFVHGMYRIGLHDRQHLAQFVFVLMLEPGAYEDERTKFIRHVRRQKSPTPWALGQTAMLDLSQYVKRLTKDGIAANNAMLWTVNQASEHEHMINEVLFSKSAAQRHGATADSVRFGNAD